MLHFQNLPFQLKLRIQICLRVSSCNSNSEHSEVVGLVGRLFSWELPLQEHHQKHPETFVPTITRTIFANWDPTHRVSGGVTSAWLPLAHRPMSSHAFRWPLASLPQSRTSASRWAQGSVGLKAPSLIWHNMSHEYWSLVRLYFGDIIVDNLCWYRTYSIYNVGYGLMWGYKIVSTDSKIIP